MTDTMMYEKALQIGQRIRSERKKAGLTGEQLAEKVSVAQNTVSGWENGKNIPPVEKLFALARLFKCDCGYLLCDYDEPIHDMKTISDTLGLSYGAIQNLRHMMKNIAAFGYSPELPNYRYAVDFLITSDYLRKFAVSMGDYEMAYRKAIEERRNLGEMRDDKGKIVGVRIDVKDGRPSYDNQYKSARNDMIETVFEITHCIEDAVEHPDG